MPFVWLEAFGVGFQQLMKKVTTERISIRSLDNGDFMDFVNMRDIGFQRTTQNRKSVTLGFVGKSRLGRTIARVKAEFQMLRNSEVHAC